ncbi:activator protein [Streptomyces armeniacus]|uniref:Activator protein n=1 Tax=Streptomyces armeniacus TaxID=83291 RepID=A0A345XLA4_9ACTN|nr:AfsR/SARP family transcriptional regulator [Streptomyces armeniacus]AXK32420.1 activator protein [Streptomyces armeniacus]
MKYEVLGPLRVTERDSHSSISARKIETVLAVLLIRSDQVVGRDQLTAEIWGDQPPRRATAGLHVYISQLRKFLQRRCQLDNPIVTQPPGYQLRKGADEIDFHIFLQLMNQGRADMRERRFEQAAERFESALSLWRGPVLGDLRAGAIVEGFVTWLTEARLECLEMLADAQLEIGRHREFVGRLYSLTAENPLRETFYRQLMLALYRSERQADALKVYQAARRTLHEELGLEPCRALQELQHAILTADDQLDFAAAV